jgi:ATPase family protein associated with various cellular activities (AAA)
MSSQPGTTGRAGTPEDTGGPHDGRTPEGAPRRALDQAWPLVLPLALLIILGLAGLRGTVAAPRWSGSVRHDVVGAPLYDQRSADMVFRPGPVFTQLLLADEINRTPPKTQAALLEAMGEGQVSVDGQTRRLPQPFIVLATDNPIEYEGTYELPEPSSTGS